MRSINFVVLGDWSIASDLGKKGSVTDITFFEKKSGDRTFSFVAPSSFPEKIQPLMQSIALAEYAIINVKSIDRNLGEQIVALDAAGMNRGFVLPNGMDDDVRRIAKSTVLEKYEFVSLEDLKQRLDQIEPVSSDGPARIIIDTSFDVKGVGAVALGVIRRGSIRKHDEMELLPQSKIVSIRSIQMHDEDVDSASSPGRVGLALKNIEAKDVSRGDEIAAKGSLRSSAEISIRFEKSRFYRGEFQPGWNYHVCLGLQIRPAKLEGSKLFLDKPVVYEDGQRFVLLDLNSSSVRIAGSGIIL
jgi:selenocysteine-specific translation elongation factor